MRIGSSPFTHPAIQAHHRSMTAAVPTSQLYVTVTEASAITGFAPYTIRKWVRLGLVKAYGHRTILLRATELVPDRNRPQDKAEHRVQGLRRGRGPKPKPPTDTGQ